MVEKIEGTAEMLLTPEESELFAKQAAAQASGTMTKEHVAYQNSPNDSEQCSGCAMFVPGFPDDLGGYCTVVRSFRGPQGIIFDDGWCDQFEAGTEGADELDEEDGDEDDD